MKDTQALVGLLSVSFLSLHIPVLKFYFSVQSDWTKKKRRKKERNVTLFRLHFLPGLSTIFSFSEAADYDVRSLLSAWLCLASNQRPAVLCHSFCYPCLDYSRARHCSSSFFLFFYSKKETSSCFLIDLKLTPSKHNLTPFSEQVSTICF